MEYEKKYKEALERALKLKVQNPFDTVGQMVEHIFPELKETEDEKIRKTLIEYIKGIKSWNYFLGISKDQMITWLEKQGEQQGKSVVEAWKDMRLEVYQQASGNRHEPNCSDDSTKMFSLNDIDEIIEKISEQKLDDKVEPKFKVGDWITNGDYTWKIVGVKPLDYILQAQDGNIVDDTISYVDEQFYSFTIEDAKKELKKIEPKKLDADKVIAWLKDTIGETKEYFGEYNVYYNIRLTLPYNSTEDLINDFKEDFGL